MRYRPVVSDIEDMSRRDTAAGRRPSSTARHGIRFPEQVAGSAPIAMARYIEIVGDLHLDVLAEFGRWAGREFGTGYLRVVESAVVRDGLGEAIAIDDGHSGRLSGSSDAPELCGWAERDSGGAGRPHVRGRICADTRGIGATR
ncbi:hypothetical protein ACQP0C_12055 [Nocardia sp. CA-129566]|uniref:hypothetical protein n=1 Tax=Nocardia sp. CA-129566 TaxID=3239976 RepID=UPI003D976D18